MSLIRSPHGTPLLRLLAAGLGLLLAMPVGAYDFPLTSSAIRDAYFLGIRQGSLDAQFRAKYERAVPELKQGNCTTQIRIETPFLQVAESLSTMPNYSAQDAVKAFYEKPMVSRIFLDICYMREAPPPNSVRIRVLQSKKVVAPASDTRTAFAERFTEESFLLPNGEKAVLEFNPQKIDSSTLTIWMDTPDGQHAECVFDMQAIR
ncbi:MAG TPA: hypothetical protein VKA02_12360 [Candidatus Acidoferrum sp.]|nr:hypothetical protein [Candidatus Acidoferrum sp.]